MENDYTQYSPNHYDMSTNPEYPGKLFIVPESYIKNGGRMQAYDALEAKVTTLLSMGVRIETIHVPPGSDPVGLVVDLSTEADQKKFEGVMQVELDGFRERLGSQEPNHRDFGFGIGA